MNKEILLTDRSVMSSTGSFQLVDIEKKEVISRGSNLILPSFMKKMSSSLRNGTTCFSVCGIGLSDVDINQYLLNFSSTISFSPNEYNSKIYSDSSIDEIIFKDSDQRNTISEESNRFTTIYMTYRFTLNKDEFNNFNGSGPIGETGTGADRGKISTVFILAKQRSYKYSGELSGVSQYTMTQSIIPMAVFSINPPTEKVEGRMLGFEWRYSLKNKDI